MALLEVKNLKVHFPIRRGILSRIKGYVRAVDDVTLAINPGETVGLIGESGSGKSTIGKAIIGLAPLTSGTIIFNGVDITRYVGRNFTSYRKEVQMIFQDSASSLNPRKRVIDILSEPIKNFEKLSKLELRKRVDELLSIVGMPPQAAMKYPFEFSGGQRQRVGVARAIALKPKLIIADEPVSALDLSVQAQVLNYLKEIQEQLGLAYLFISHDLGVVKHMCETLAIMHNARFVEYGNRDDIYNDPRHIYTRRLVTAIPDVDPDKREINALKRAELGEEYEREYSRFYGEGGKVYDLKMITGTHYVATSED